MTETAAAEISAEQFRRVLGHLSTGVTVITAHREDLTLRFSRRGSDRFAGVSWHARDGGPALDDALAWIECTVRAEHDGGDHTIVVLDVLRLEAAPPREPLVFFRGAYGTFVERGR